MTKKTTLHRWALIDKAGKTRGTCEATSSGDALRRFKDSRGLRPIPSGWTVKRRGPVEAKPEPRRWKLEDFHVGDTIRLKANHWAVKHEGVPEGTTTMLVEREQGGHFRTDLKPCADKEYAIRFTPIEYTEAQVEKVEPAPQPKAEEGKPVECHRAHPHEDDGCPLNHPQHVEVLRDRARLAGEVERMKVKEGKREAPAAICLYCMEKEFFYHIYGVSGARRMLREHHGVCTSNPLVQEIATLKEEALRFYHADGTFEVLSTPQEVVDRRRRYAKMLAQVGVQQGDVRAVARLAQLDLLSSPAIGNCLMAILDRS